MYIGNRCGEPQLPLEAHHTQGININTGEDVAIKLEHVSIDPSLLEGEADTYRSLSGGVGIPRVHAYVKYHDFFRCMAG